MMPKNKSSHLPDKFTVTNEQWLRLPYYAPTSVGIVGMPRNELTEYPRIYAESISFRRDSNDDGTTCHFKVNLGKNAINGFAIGSDGRSVIFSEPITTFDVSSGPAGQQIWLGDTFDANEEPQLTSEFMTRDVNDSPVVTSWAELVYGGLGHMFENRII